MNLRIRIALVCICAALPVLSGCAGVPRKSSAPGVAINGVSYALLTPFCDSHALRQSYDPQSRTVTVSGRSHQVVMAVAEPTVLIDGAPQQLRHAPDMYKGSLVIPDALRRQLETLLGAGTAAAPAVAPAFDRIRRICIDAGHGGRDPGALGRRGVREKDITLDLAKRLAAELQRQGVQVTMVRSDDRYVALDDRVRIANESRADLFVSIHANASRSRSVNGFEVYHISGKVSDTDRAMTSLRASPFPLDGACYAGASSEVKATVWDLIHSYNRNESVELARSVCRSIGCGLAPSEKSVKNANFCVLRGTAIPGVLVEVGYLSNARDLRLLQDNGYRQSLVEGIACGLKEYDLSLNAPPAGRQRDSYCSTSKGKP